jgi:hypothetical protein
VREDDLLGGLSDADWEWVTRIAEQRRKQRQAQAREWLGLPKIHVRRGREGNAAGVGEVRVVEGGVGEVRG